MRLRPVSIACRRDAGVHPRSRWFMEQGEQVLAAEVPAGSSGSRRSSGASSSCGLRGLKLKVPRGELFDIVCSHTAPASLDRVLRRYLHSTSCARLMGNGAVLSRACHVVPAGNSRLAISELCLDVLGTEVSPKLKVPRGELSGHACSDMARVFLGRLKGMRASPLARIEGSSSSRSFQKFPAGNFSVATVRKRFM